jgi:hypothetical protein
MDEIDAIKAIASALEGLQADAQIRVLSWAQAKYGGGSVVPLNNTTLPPAGGAGQAFVHATAVKPKGTKKAKVVISMDKSLNLSPPGKQSALQFAALKTPTNALQKCVVAVHYLRDVIEMPKVKTDAVLTFFKTVQWPVPADLKNTLQQAGSAGWLDTANSEDIKLTSSGENLVEHQLPAKKA